MSDIRNYVKNKAFTVSKVIFEKLYDAYHAIPSVRAMDTYERIKNSSYFDKPISVLEEDAVSLYKIREDFPKRKIPCLDSLLIDINKRLMKRKQQPSFIDTALSNS